MKLIYENDIPDNYLDYSDDFIHRQVHDSEEWVGHRFKPNGITDNRDEWRKKMGYIGICCFCGYHVKEDQGNENAHYDCARDFEIKTM